MTIPSFVEAPKHNMDAVSHIKWDSKVPLELLQARKAYERALVSKEPRIYDYSLYKLAWCDYNIQEYAAGITKLKKVIDRLLADVAG